MANDEHACGRNLEKKIAAETYSKIADLILSPEDIPLATPKEHYGYRNKMEFSFAHLDPADDADKANYHPTSIALFERGKHIRKPVQDTSIADPSITTTAKYIESWIQEVKIPLRSLKSLIIRSNNAGETIAALFLKDTLTFDSYPTLTNELKGFHVYYSTHRSPASVPTKRIYTEGQDYLIANILGTKLKFGLLSFFQINIPLFTEALKDIAAFLPPKNPLSITMQALVQSDYHFQRIEVIQY